MGAEEPEVRPRMLSWCCSESAFTLCCFCFCSFQNIARENKELQNEIEELRQRQEVMERSKKELELVQVKVERDVQYWQDRAEEYAKMVSAKLSKAAERSKLTFFLVLLCVCH